MNDEARIGASHFLVVILELPKLPEEEDSAIWSWLRFLKCKEMEEFEMLAAKHPELENPVECVRYMSLRESWRTLMTRRLIRNLDENTMKKHLREEGLAEGIERGLSQGRDQEKLEIARKMKARGRPLEEIAEDTGLSPEAVEQL